VPIDGMDRLRKRLRELVPDATEEGRMALRGAWRAVELITERTIRGYDRHGRPFRPYAQSTREQRRKRGRQTDHVDLHDTGSMLAAMQSRLIGQGKAEVRFASAREAAKAAAHQYGRGNLPKREFFGLTPKERQEVLSVITRRELFRRGR